VCTGGKVLVAASATPAVGNNNALVRLAEVVHPLPCGLVIKNGAHRDFEDHAFAIASGTVGAFAVASALTLVFRIETEVDQRIVPLAGFHYDVAAVAAIAAGRAAARDKLLPAKGHASVATVASLNANDCFVNKHASLFDCTVRPLDSPQRRKPRCHAGLGRLLSYAFAVLLSHSFRNTLPYFGR